MGKGESLLFRKTIRTFACTALFLAAAALVYFLYLLPPETPSAVDGELCVTFFDVGQADCILVQEGKHAMLIDAGNIGQDELILGYLAENGVTKLDYLVATHPHADHIGSMAAVVREMESIGEILMPDATANTKVFERLLDAIEETDFPVTVPEPDNTFVLGDALITILAPAEGPYKDLNDASIVMRVTYGDVSFLFTGDAEALSESEQIASGYTLRSDVLKAGHHGSSSSTTQAYLDKVKPGYAVISCGEGNTYGHPHREIIDRLAAKQVEVYRTDKDGTVVFVTDGTEITATTGGAK